MHGIQTVAVSCTHPISRDNSNDYDKFGRLVVVTLVESSVNIVRNGLT